MDDLAPNIRTNEGAQLVLRGRVLDAESGRGIARALVFLSRDQDPVALAADATATDDSGAFVLRGKGSLRVIGVVAEGYLGEERAVEASSDLVEFRLRAGATIIGTVVDSWGAPIVGARVVATRFTLGGAWPASPTFIARPSRESGSAATSTGNGSFRMTGLEREGAYFLQASQQGYLADEGHEPPRVQAGTEDARIVLHQRTTLLIRFVDSTIGRVLPLGPYFLSAPGLRVMGPIETPDPDGWGGAAANWTGGQVRVELGPREGQGALPTGAVKMRLRARPCGYGDVDAELEAQLGATNEWTIRATRLDSDYAEVRPVARFADGSPYSGWITLRVSTHVGEEDRQGEWPCEFREGRASTPIALPVGSYGVTPVGCGPLASFWDPAGPSTRWSVAAGDQEYRLTLIGNPLRLRVYGPEGQRVRSFMLESAGDSGHALSPMWDLGELGDRTAATVLWVGGGHVSLTARSRNLHSGPISVETNGEGQTLDVELQLK